MTVRQDNSKYAMLAVNMFHDFERVLARPRMRPVVDHFQLRSGELRVALCGGEALVAEQLLDGAQVGAFFQEMCAEGVTQSVRMNVGGETAPDGNAFDDAAHTARGQARLAARLAQTTQLKIEKQRGSFDSLPFAGRGQMR